MLTLKQKENKKRYQQSFKGKHTTKNYMKSKTYIDYKKDYYKTDSAKLKQLNRTYGPDASQNYIQAYCEQEGYCKICCVELFYLHKNTHYDHNHSTGKFRGLLCSQCNSAIGLLNEDIKVIKSAEFYLTH